MSKFNNGQSFVDGDTVTGAKLNNITGLLDIYTGLISEQTAMVATVSTADQLLIADTDNGDSGAANRVTIQKLLNDTLTNGTYTNANLSGQLTYGTATGNRTVSTSATITTGTIPNLTSSTANITLGTIPTLTTGTTTSTAANITNGTVQTLTASTGTIGTFNSTTGTIATLNSTTGTITGLRSTTGTVATLNSTTGTITGLNTTTGTIATLNSTTGTITNLSTTLAGDFTISQGTGTIGAAKVTPANLSQPFTSVAAVASTSGTAIDFTSIPSWVKRVTINLLGVSTNGVSTLRFRIGPVAGVETSGYLGSCLGFQGVGTATINFTAGFDLNDSATAAAVRHGSFILSLANLSTNTWTIQGTQGQSNTTAGSIIGGHKPLADTLSVLRITTVNGTDVFDAGSVSILYEG